MPTLEYDFALGIGMNEDDELHSIISKGLNTISFEDIALIFDSCIEDNETYYFEMLYYQHPLLLVFIAVVIVSLFLITLLVILYTRRIQKKNTELSIAKNAQSDFLSRMSHDMRTPMNGILGISYLAKDKTDVKEMQKDFRQIESSGNLLLNLINDTLEMNKIESGKLILNPELCNEHQIFDSIFDTIRPLAQKKNINFIINIQDINWKYLKIDYKKLQQIFVNIIGNSIKFTPEGGKIEFIMECLWEKKDILRDRFTIRDTGIGMSKEFLKHIFEPFTQENRLKDSSVTGTGLGMSIVYRLIQLMGGTIEVNSKINEGSEFIIELEFPYTAAINEEDESKKNLANNYNLSGKRILLCEDQVVNRIVVVNILAKLGIMVETAENGEIGLQMFKNSAVNYYDAILMDIRMPIMDGLESTKQIRALNKLDANTIPIIAMSANAYEEDIKKSIDAGMNAHLSKPINPPLVFETLNKYLNKNI